MRLGKGRHAGVAGERGAQHEHGDGGARSFAEPHAEIEQRRKAELFEQEAVARFGRSMTGQRMVERIGAKLTVMTPEQERYLGTPANGPFKPDQYRY